MKLKKPFIGIIAFLIVLFTMPLGHATMILMEKGFGHEHVFIAALILGFVGLGLLIAGILAKKEIYSTFWGLFAGLFIWTGWVEFAFVYYANRYGVPPLMENGEIITKPEYLIMPSSVGFLVIFMLYYLFGIKTGCKFFSWIQRKLNIDKKADIKPARRNIAIVTFSELILLLWTFYLVLLFSYDTNFLGDKHPVTYGIAFISLLWSLFLFIKLIKINNLSYALRYSIPTVIIFWNFVEILGRWDLFKEIWVEPGKYWIEMLLTLIVFLCLITFSLINKKSNRNKNKLI